MLCTPIHTMYSLIAIWLVPEAGGIFSSEIIKNVSSVSGNLLNDLRYYGKKSFGETSFFNLDYLCFYHYLLARNCTVCRESCHNYNSSGLPHAFRSIVEKIKMLFTSLGRPVLEKLCPLSWVPKYLEYPRPRVQFFPIRTSYIYFFHLSRLEKCCSSYRG